MPVHQSRRQKGLRPWLGRYLQVGDDTSVYTVDTSTVQALLLTENDLRTQEWFFCTLHRNQGAAYIFFAAFYKVSANIGRVIDNPTVIVYYKP